ncbi:MAG: hypothetical protein ACK4GU_13475 [Alishewanella aestuarii]
MSTLAQNVPGSPVQNTGGQSIWGNVTGFLNGALDAYARYETIRAGQNAQAVYDEKMYLTPLPSGQAVVVEGANGQGFLAGPSGFVVAGYEIPKPVAYGGLMVLALVLLKKGGIL